MEDYLKSKLNTKVLERIGSDSGCINNGNIYETDRETIFVKHNLNKDAETMFEGEFVSLEELSRTKSVKVPKPLLVGKIDEKSFLVMEYIKMRSLSKFSSRLGTLIAEMHLDNIRKLETKNESRIINSDTSEAAVDRFGFHVSTACGSILQNNDWCEDWLHFFARQKLEQQVNLILSKHGNREVNELWSQLQLKLPLFFKNINIKPSLLHGDLWFGNCGETNSEPIIFDPACFYGHHEYDLAIATMFSGFNTSFFNAYHALLPKSVGFQERQQIYLLFHHLNHWNHFGSHKNSSLQIMKKLLLK